MTAGGSRWVTFGLVVFIVAFICGLALSVGGLVRLLVICALLAYVLDPLASFLESLGASRTGATVLIFILVGGVIATLSILLYPIFVEQLTALQAGEYTTQTNALVTRMETFLREKFAFAGLGNLNLAAEVQRAKDGLGKGVAAFLFTDVVSSVAHVVAVPFIIFFLLKDGREMKRRLIGLVPNRYFEFSLDVLYKLDLALGNFLRGQFLDGLIFGILATIAMWLLDVKYFLFVGVFAGLANLIPYVGPIAGAVFAVLVVISTANDLTRVFYVVLAFAVVKLLDDAVIQPLAVARSVKMHPLIVLLVIIIGGHYFGILGMLLAVPVAGFLKVAIEASISLYQKYRLAKANLS